MGKGIGFGMISCVERTSLHFCSDAAAARVANARMQSSGASHRLCEAYCQRPAGRSFPDAHVAFHDVFFRGEPSARCGRSGRVVGASRRPVRSWDAPRRLSCPAEACSRWPTRWRHAGAGQNFSLALCTPAGPMLSWVVGQVGRSQRQAVRPRGNRAAYLTFPRAGRVWRAASSYTPPAGRPVVVTQSVNEPIWGDTCEELVK